MIAKLLKMFMNWIYPNRSFVQCKVQKMELGDYTCCVKKAGHKGPHMNLEGQHF